MHAPPNYTVMLPFYLFPLGAYRNLIVRAGSTAVQIDEDVLDSEIWTTILQNAPKRSPGALTVLVLSDDGQDLLRYVDHVYSVNAVPREPIALEALRSLLNMGRKYDPGLFAEMLDIVTSEFPPTLRAWDLAHEAQFTAISWTAGIEFDLLEIAHKYDLYSVLPTLLYRICCIFTPADRHLGITRSIGTRATLTTKQEELSAVATRRLAIAQRSLTFGWLHRGEIPVQGCATVRVCEAFVCRTSLDVQSSVQPIRPLQKWDASWNGGMCAKCERQARKIHYFGRKEVWKNLPAYFDLKPWKETTELQAVLYLSPG
ncbi:hypothetical protein FPV67DRAFT_1675348 [Lyophyllum atratum]|nr:hypothetical protein FPV67DRAFT_1675348 [Lyophyllum atratum]